MNLLQMLLQSNVISRHSECKTKIHEACKGTVYVIDK